MHARIERLARESGVVVFGVNTAFTETRAVRHGIGIGVRSAQARSIALVGDEGISQPSYGATWYVLEQRYGIPFTPVSARWLAFGDLSRFNVIIIPDGVAGNVEPPRWARTARRASRSGCARAAR